MNPWGVTVPAATEAEFFNAARHTAFLLVEGEDDRRFWASRVDPHRCKVRVMGGRELALTELAVARDEGIAGLVAILDADFDRLDGALDHKRPDVAWTDHHDLEMVLLASPALEKVLVEVASAKKLQEFEAREGCSLRAALLVRATPLGRLRWHSRRQQLKLTFRKRTADGFDYLPYAKFCPPDSWEVEHHGLVKKVLDFSSRHELKAESLLAQSQALAAADPWQLCVGHDVVGLLAVGLRKRLGSRNLSIEDLQERLRLAFERAHLEATSMYRELRVWEARQKHHRVLKADGGAADQGGGRTGAQA